MKGWATLPNTGLSVAGLVAALMALAACSSSGETPGPHDTAPDVSDVPDVLALAEIPDGHRDANLSVDAGGAGLLDGACVDGRVVPVGDATADSDVSQTSPQLVFSPSVGTFAGSRPSVDTFYLANPTDVAVGPVRVTVMGPNAADFVATVTGCDLIAPLSFCKVEVSFTPTTGCPETASLVATGPAPDFLTATALLDFTRSERNPISVAPGTSDFGPVAVGTTGLSRSFTVENWGNSCSGVTDVGPLELLLDSTEFVITDDICSGAIIPVGGACTFGVAFRPTAAGRTAALLTVVSSKPVSAVLSGTGFITLDGGPGNPADSGPAIATLTMTPPALAFDGIPLLVQSGEKLVTIANTGGASTGVLDPPKAPGAGFEISSSTCPTALKPMDTCTIGFKFTPEAISAVYATFSLTSTSGAIGTLALSGTGRLIMPLEISPVAVRGCDEPHASDAGTAASSCFADTALGQADGSLPGKMARMPVAFTVTNVSDGAISLTSGSVTVKLAGANPSDFAIVPGTCGPAMVPSGRCTFGVSFRPTAPGLRKATVEVTATNGGNARATLEATGLPSDGGA